MLKYNRKNFSIKRGVSLLELLIVMGIITIVTAIAIPSINYFLPSLRLSTSAKEISTKMRQAQEEAVTTQIRHIIRFAPQTTPPMMQFIKLDGATETVIETINFNSGITLSLDASFQDPVTHNFQVIFSSDGGPNVSGNIIITYAGVGKTINLTPAGVIKIVQ